MGVLKKILLKYISKNKIKTDIQTNIEEDLKAKPKKEKIQVKRKGVTMSKKINYEENEEKEQRINKII